MLGQARPLVFGELHALPVLESRLIQVGEALAPLIVTRRLGCRDVSLELHGVRAGVGDGIDESVGGSQAAVVGLGYLSNDREPVEVERAHANLTLPRRVGSARGRR